MTEVEFGQPLPRNLEYAVSFGIPTWESAIGYVEKNPYYISKMLTGYPRYFPQPAIQKLCDHFLQKLGRGPEDCRPFPSLKSASDCLEYVKLVRGSLSRARLETETFHLDREGEEFAKGSTELAITIAAVFASGDDLEIVKEYWKLTGECVSSRQAEFVSKVLEQAKFNSKPSVHKMRTEFQLLKRKGEEAKALLKKRIADNHCNPFGVNEKPDGEKLILLDATKDVYLVSSGMSAIFTTRKLLTYWEKSNNSQCLTQKNEIISGKQHPACNTTAVFGFPFKDTKVIMEKFGKCQFFGFGDSRDIAELNFFLKDRKERILAVFLETPSNPMLNMPDLKQLRSMADENGFFIVIDDTIGGLNTNILPYADVVCTSLTKLFSGSSNVMGGSIVLNPRSALYSCALEYFGGDEFEELLWLQDAIALEVNSRDFEERTIRTNNNTRKLIQEVLLPEEGNIFKKIYYPMISSKETFRNYEFVRTNRGGYGSLFSLSFFNEEDAKAFYNSLEVFKGPSNGTNFTLACPYVHLAHHFELEEVSRFGADPSFVRVSVGLEEFSWLASVFTDVLELIRKR
ncbi:LAQU0S36e00100g1_1 [Lachancea quebecensis]|uniref:LAQU0S36e00100g1_1 n=1 Tax=Lachancea quebecensis TaxID=1654605 RepID=A0A0P1KZ05_9SACH|nr:LAQU0S36e00100g1_1 [Lachancea quebecensis]